MHAMTVEPFFKMSNTHDVALSFVKRNVYAINVKNFSLNKS